MDFPLKLNAAPICITITFFFWVIPAFASLSHGKDLNEDVYKRGLELIDQNEVEAAINLWIPIKAELESKGCGDFRIGIKAIESITEAGLTRLYPLATEFYFWGLSSCDTERDRDYIMDEIYRLEPLVSPIVFNSWIKLAQTDKQQVLSEIRGFFIKQNPLQTTSRNERLIEHWERIAHARKHFQRNSSSAYGTDDRGIIYVRYGEPDKIESGNFTLNMDDILSISSEILYQQQEARMNDPTMGDGIQSASAWISDEIFRDNLSKLIGEQVLSQRVTTEYEVWIYNHYNLGQNRNTTFLFGVDARTQRYGMYPSIEAFIPLSAFRERTMRLGGFRFNAGPVIQLAFYKELRFVDDTFNDIYYDYFDRLMSDRSIIGESSYSHMYYRYADQLEGIRNAIPANVSLYDQGLAEFEITYTSYRFFDEDLQPYEIVFFYSMPHQEILTDYYSFGELNPDASPEYHLRHSLDWYTNDWTLIERTTDFPLVFFDKFTADGRLMPASSSFTVPVDEAAGNLLFTGTLFNRAYTDYDQSQLASAGISGSAAIPADILAETSLEVDLRSIEMPLSKQEPTFSDVILGYTPEGDHELVPPEALIPFHVPMNPVIPVGADLDLFFDVYNLDALNKDTANESPEPNVYMLRYRIQAPDQRGLFGRIFGSRQEQEQSVVLSFSTMERSFNHYLSIETSHYPEGDYELVITLLGEDETMAAEKRLPFQILSEE